MRRLGPALGILVFVLAGSASEVSGFDFSRYRPISMKELVKTYPAQKGLAITPDIAIRSKVTYSSEFRDLPPDSHRLVAVWAESMGVPRARQVFLREMKINEAGIERWVPVQEVLVRFLKAELRPGEEIELFMVYIGQVDGRHLFLVNEFDHESRHQHRSH